MRELTPNRTVAQSYLDHPHLYVSLLFSHPPPRLCVDRHLDAMHTVWWSMMRAWLGQGRSETRTWEGKPLKTTRGRRHAHGQRHGLRHAWTWTEATGQDKTWDVTWAAPWAAAASTRSRTCRMASLAGPRARSACSTSFHLFSPPTSCTYTRSCPSLSCSMRSTVASVQSEAVSTSCTSNTIPRYRSDQVSGEMGEREME